MTCMIDSPSIKAILKVSEDLELVRHDKVEFN